MSGPKSSSYYVDSAAEIERRALAQAVSRLARAKGAAVAVQAEADRVMRAYGTRLARLDLSVSAAGHSAAVEAQAVRLEREMTELAQETARRRQAARRAVVASIADPAGVAEHHSEVDTNLQSEVGRLNAAARAAAVQAERSARGAQAAALLAQVTDEVEVDALEAITRFAEAYVAAEGGAAAVALARLRDAVSSANGLAVGRAAAAAASAPILLLLDGIESPSALALRSELEAAMADGTTLRPDVRADAEAIAADWVVAGDATYAAGVIADGLQELGYFVEEGFETLVVAGSGALVVSRDSEHGVRVFRGAAGQLVFAPVALAPETTAEEQTEFETTFCADYAEVARQAGTHGVRLGLERDVPAGEGVQNRLASDAVAKTTRDKRRRVAREMQRKL